MANENVSIVKAHLKALHRGLDETEHVDDELEILLRQLDGDIKHALELQAEQNQDANTYGLASRTQELAARFALKHPHLQLTLLELANILNTMGI